MRAGIDPLIRTSIAIGSFPVLLSCKFGCPGKTNLEVKRSCPEYIDRSMDVCFEAHFITNIKRNIQNECKNDKNG